MDTSTTTTNTSTGTPETLSNELKENYKAKMRPVAIDTLADKPELTMKQLAQLLEHKEHGPVIATITLNDLVEARVARMDRSALNDLLSVEAEDADEEAPKRPAVRKVGKKVAKKTSKKVAKKVTQKGGRAKLDRENGYPAILKAIKKNEQAAISVLVDETGISTNHVRTMLRELIEEGKINQVGGGRGTQYEMA